jgi:hypothetical protein
MNPTETTQTGRDRAVQPVMPASRGVQRPLRADVSAAAATAPTPQPQRRFYGLPCAKCKTYYASDLQACPVCLSTERVSPVEPEVTAAPAVEEVSDAATLDQERERFLRSFKTQLQASKLEINTVQDHACSRTHNHPASFQPATICETCYLELHERADQMEAALHMDLKDATSVIYEAVWADPADPSKTYQNAAQALLEELRRRAGIQLVLGSLQPLPH